MAGGASAPVGHPDASPAGWKAAVHDRLDAHPLVREHFGEALAREAPDRAVARMRGLCQWGLWPQLVRVAEELGAQTPEMSEAPAPAWDLMAKKPRTGWLTKLKRLFRPAPSS